MSEERDALPRRKKNPDYVARAETGAVIQRQYRRWLRTTEAGQAEREAMKGRIQTLRETWERKGI